MKQLSIRKNILIIFLFLGTIIQAQNNSWYIFNNLNSGIPTNWIWSLAIDCQGNKWVGTFADGLVKFNNNDWEVYYPGNSDLPGPFIGDIESDYCGNVWMSVNGFANDISYGIGLVRFDGDTSWTTFSTQDSVLPSNDILNIFIDIHNNIVVGTNEGLVYFDGLNWTTYDTTNFGGSINSIELVAIDSSEMIWAAIYNQGLVKFDGTSWTRYNTSNSDLPDDNVTTLSVDPGGTLLIGTEYGYAEYNGENWITYHFGLGINPDLEFITSIAVEDRLTKWIGTNGGLVKLFLDTWTVYSTVDSIFPVDYINEVVLDSAGNKWIGTFGEGLVVFNEDGIVGIQEDHIPELPKGFSLSQNFPNPFNSTTTIQYSIPVSSEVTITFFNLIGEEVKTIKYHNQEAGQYLVTWDGKDNRGNSVSTGIYFYHMKAGEFIQTRKMLIIK